MSMNISLTVNGVRYNHVVEPRLLLVHYLRDVLRLTGTHVGCDTSSCGACNILVNGKATKSCTLLAVQADNCVITTIEGLAKDDPVIVAFAEQCEPGYGTAMQCGFCTPGFVLTAKAFLNANPRPTLEEIKEALSGNICRCGCYTAIAHAVLHASQKVAAKGGAHA